MVRMRSRVQIPVAAPAQLGIITPCFAGGFLVCNGVIYQQVDSSVDILNDYGLPVKAT